MNRLVFLTLSSILLAGCVARTKTVESPSTTSGSQNAVVPEPLRGRLTPKVLPLNYRIALKIDPGVDDFSGTEDIRIQLRASTSVITLNARDIRIDSASVLDGDQHRDATVEYRPADQTVQLSFAEPLYPGVHDLTVTWSAKMAKLAGLYRVQRDGQHFAFTQFEPSDARRMFPCFDEPSMKARFSVSVIMPPGNVAVSNMPVIRQESSSDGKVTVSFAESPPLSTYLVALAIGPFSVLEDRTGAVPIRVFANAKSIPMGRYALKIAREALPRLEKYFGIAYPYPKLDLIAVPDFTMGAMENAGAITFRDSFFLLDEPTASPWQLREVMRTVVHEMSHQWFGDLVTMAWWDDLWLNESFARWLEYKIVAEMRPNWSVWNDFEFGRQSAMAKDAHSSTHAIHQQILTPAEANNAFDSITYHKGAAVLRMLERYVGADTFAQGVALYLRTHREGNTTAVDLWTALENVSQKPVGRIASAWINFKGFPVVSVNSTCRNGRTKVELSQHRFLLASETGSDDTTWPIPVCMRTDRGQECDLMTKAQESFDLVQDSCATWIDGNAEAAGFYAAQYSDPLVDSLSRVATEKLMPTERMALLSETYRLAYQGAVPLRAYLETADRMRNDTEYSVLRIISNPLFWLRDDLLSQSDIGPFADVVENLFRPTYRRLGADPKLGESQETKMLRTETLMTLGFLARSRDVVKHLDTMKDRFLSDPNSVDAAIAWPAIAVPAQIGGDDELWNRYHSAYLKATTPEQRDTLLYGLSRFTKPALVYRTLNMLMSDDIAPSDVMTVIGYLLGDVHSQKATWEFVKLRYEDIKRKVPEQSMPWLLDDLASFCDPAVGADIDKFFESPSHRIDGADRNLKGTLESIRVCTKFREREASSFAHWIRESTARGGAEDRTHK